MNKSTAREVKADLDSYEGAGKLYDVLGRAKKLPKFHNNTIMSGVKKLNGK